MDRERNEQDTEERPMHDVPEREETLVRDELRHASHRAQVRRDVLTRDSLEAFTVLREPRRADRFDEQAPAHELEQRVRSATLIGSTAQAARVAGGLSTVRSNVARRVLSSGTNFAMRGSVGFAAATRVRSSVSVVRRPYKPWWIFE